MPEESNNGDSKWGPICAAVTVVGVAWAIAWAFVRFIELVLTNIH